MAYYKVQKGDSLSLIAWRKGRAPEDVLVLYSGNTVLIGPDPHKLEIGWDLYVPDDWAKGNVRIGVPDRTWALAAARALRSVGLTAQPETALVPAEQSSLAPPPPPVSPRTIKLRRAGAALGGLLALLGIGFAVTSSRTGAIAASFVRA